MLRDLSERQLRRFLGKIRRAARRVVKDDARADDARQEAALALLEGKTPAEPVRSAAGFAAVLGRNKGLDQARKSRRRKTVPLAGAEPRDAKAESGEQAEPGRGVRGAGSAAGGGAIGDGAGGVHPESGGRPLGGRNRGPLGPVHRSREPGLLSRQ